MPNVELFQQIKHQVEWLPESLQMGTWFTREARCGTAACVAGWAVHLTDGPGVFCDSGGNQSVNTTEMDFCLAPNGRVVQVEDRATELLELTNRQAGGLFFDMSVNATNFAEKVREHVGVEI